MTTVEEGDLAMCPDAMPLTVPAIRLLKKMLHATSYERLRWGPAQHWCPSRGEAHSMASLLYAELVRAEPPDTANGAVYYFQPAKRTSSSA